MASVSPSSRPRACNAAKSNNISPAGFRDANQPQPNGSRMNPLSQIRQIDYTVIFTRDMRAMRDFYESVMEFPVLRTLGDGWIEFGVGSNRLALRVYGSMFNDTPPPAGALSMQMAFRVVPAEVEK